MRNKQQYLSKTAAAILPALQTDTRSAYAARICYGVLGFIYYATKYYLVSKVRGASAATTVVKKAVFSYRHHAVLRTHAAI